MGNVTCEQLSFHVLVSRDSEGFASGPGGEGKADWRRHSCWIGQKAQAEGGKAGKFSVWRQADLAPDREPGLVTQLHTSGPLPGRRRCH